MEFSDNFESFNHFHNDPFGHLLDEEIPQNIFDELMNDVNCNALGFDMNSVSSEDSGRSSSSYDDLASRLDTLSDQTMLDVPQIKAETIKQEHIDEEPKSPIFMSTIDNANNKLNTISVRSEPIDVARPVFATQQSCTQIQQPHFVLSQSKIVVKQEPIKFNTQPNAQQIFTLQTVDGQQFVVTNANQTPVHTIVNGTTGILTKIPVVPVTGIIQHPTIVTPKTTAVTTVALQPTKVTAKPITHVTTTAIAKTSKKSGHNIIERRYRTSIVIIQMIFGGFQLYILESFKCFFPFYSSTE